jgi:hypothetical protein
MGWGRTATESGDFCQISLEKRATEAAPSVLDRFFPNPFIECTLPKLFLCRN